jgi:hypothetical protein
MISQAPVDQADLIAGYQRASSIKPVKMEDLNKVYSEYGLKSGQVRGQSDSVLRKRAAQAVVAWWKKQQVTTPKPAAKPATKPAARPAAARPAPVAARTSAPTPVGNAAASAAVRQGNANRARVMQANEAARTQPYVNASPRPLTASQAAVSMKKAGVAGTPPAYALLNQQALDAWIARLKYNRKLIANRQTVAMRVTERAPAPAPRRVGGHQATAY